MARQMKDSGVEWIREIPEHWGYVRLKHFYDFEKGKNAAQYTQEYIGSHSGKYPVYSGQTENNGIMGEIDTFDYDIEECLFTTTVGAKVMTPRILYGKFSLSQNCLIMKQIDECSNKFFYYMLLPLFDYEKSLIPTYMQPSLRMEDLRKYALYIPEKYEQQEIADFLDEKVGEIDSVIVKTKETIEDCKKYKQAIITDAVTKGLNHDVEMKESKTSYLGLIPAHWNEKRLRFLGMCQNGISKSSEYFGEGYPFVSYGDVYKNYTLPEMGSGLIKSSEEDRNIYSVQYGDVFFTRTSETIEEVGFASTCLKSIDNATFAGFVIRFRPNNQEELLPEFSKYYFRSDAHRKFFVKEMNLVTRASLSQELLKKLPVLLPPIEEQKEIAEYLDEECSEIDNLIAKKEELLADLEDYKKSLIYEYVTGKKEVG